MTVRFAAAIVAAVVAGCARGGAPPSTADVPSLEASTARKPPQVALAPTLHLPEPSGAADAEGIVALREPVHESAAARVVRRFFDVAVSEEHEALRLLFSADAILLAPLKGAAPLVFWQARHRALDYAHLSGLELVPEKGVRRFGYADLAPGKSRARPPEMQEGDLLVVVPVTTPRLGTDRYFGDVVVFLLRREGADVKIVGYGEEN